MEKIKIFLKFLFNSNTGYFLNEHGYYYEGRRYKGWVLCRGYRFLGIPGFERLEIFTDLDEAQKILNSHNIK